MPCHSSIQHGASAAVSFRGWCDGGSTHITISRKRVFEPHSKLRRISWQHVSTNRTRWSSKKNECPVETTVSRWSVALHVRPDYQSRSNVIDHYHCAERFADATSIHRIPAQFSARTCRVYVTQTACRLSPGFVTSGGGKFSRASGRRYECSDKCDTIDEPRFEGEWSFYK